MAETTAAKPISIYGRNSASGTYGYFKEHTLKNGDYKNTVKEQPGSASVVEGVAKDIAAIVAADVDDAGSIGRAFQGAYGAFCVTFYWAHFSPEKELTQATAMAHATKRAGNQHVIWSSLEDTRKWVPLSDNRMPTLMGKYKVPHFDAKGEADQVFSGLGLPYYGAQGAPYMAGEGPPSTPVFHPAPQGVDGGPEPVPGLDPGAGHDDEAARALLADLVNGADVRMIQDRGGLGFSQ